MLKKKPFVQNNFQCLPINFKIANGFILGTLSRDFSYQAKALFWRDVH